MKEQIHKELSTLKELKGRALAEHLFTYYKWRILAIVLCLIIILSTVIKTINKKDILLSGILLNYTAETSQDMISALSHDFMVSQEVDEAEFTVELITSLSYLKDNAEFATDTYMTVENITARVSGKLLDFVACDLKAMGNLAYSEFFVDLSSVLTEEQFEQYKPYLLYIDLAIIEQLEQIADSENYDAEITLPDFSKPETMENPIPVFVDISGSHYFASSYSNFDEPIVLAVAANAPHEDAIRDFIDFLMKEQ